MPNATLRDVAAAAGVHPATVSRALNPQTRWLVNADTARKVERAAESLGYVANPMARTLKTARSRTIGVVLPDLTNPLFPPIVRGVQDVLSEEGYSGLIVNTDNDPATERRQVASLQAWRVEGLVVATALIDHPLLEELHRRGVRMVLVNRRAGGVDLPSVAADDATGVEEAVRHLAALGHRRILHLAGPQDTSTGVTRALAFSQAVSDLGLDSDPVLVASCRSWSEEEGARVLAELMSGRVDFTAIVAGNDLIALGCYDVLDRRGLRCPDDVSVVGFNDIPFLDKLRIPLTTVSVPTHRIGLEACRMLLAAARGGPPSESLVLPVSLVVRRSTGPSPARRLA